MSIASLLPTRGCALLLGVLTPLVSVPDARSQDLTASSDDPTVNFVDTGSVVPENTWDLVAGNGTIRFRDIVGATDPFVLTDGCPLGSLTIVSNFNGAANVGIGTGPSKPAFPLHVLRTEESATRIAHFEQTRTDKSVVVGFQNNAAASPLNSCGFDFLLRDNAGSKISSRVVCSLVNLNPAAASAAMQFQVLDNGATSTAMKIQGSRVSIGTNQSTDLLRVLNATCNGATWNNACSRELKQEIALLPATEAQATLAALTPVTYAYKHAPDEPRVGFVAEDVPERVALADGKSLSAMDIVAVLTKVMQEQERQLEAQQRELEMLRAQQAAVLARLAAIEAKDNGE